MGHRKLTWQGRWLAATLAVKGSVLSHISAVMAFGMLRPSLGVVHVSVEGRSQSRRGIQVHESVSLRRGTFDDIPIVAPATAIRQLCSMRQIPDHWCSRAMNQALVDMLTTMDELFEEAHTRRSGARRMKRLIWSAAPARSRLEDETIKRLKRAGLPPFKANLRLHDHEVDLYFPTLNLVVELNPERYHGNPFAQAHDRWKKKDLEEKGKTVWIVSEGQDLLRRLSSLTAPMVSV